MLKRILVYFVLICSFQNTLHAQTQFSKVVLWGHKLTTHTHSWIHWGFKRAFQSMGYEVHWLDNSDDVSDIDFSNTLFITEGQVDGKIPLRSDCRYILHNCDAQKYQTLLESGNCINLQVYTYKCEKEPVEKIDACIYADYHNKFIYMPWGTDLLPHEIEQNKKTIQNVQKKKTVCWIGTIGGQKFGNLNQVKPFRQAAERSGLAFFEKFMFLSMEENIQHVQESFVAPAIVGAWQLNEGYIPCRIFKNISYGAMGVTNSKAVYDLFEQKIVYNQDTKQLFYDAKERIENLTWDELFELMDMVRDRHTYLNRIEHLFNFMNKIKPFDNP